MSSEAFHASHAAQARLVTREFRGLQGYRMLPWVAPVLLWWGSEAGVLRGDWWGWAFGASLVGAALGSWRIGRWYTRTYGKVHSRDAEQSRKLGAIVLFVLGVWVLVAVLGVAGLWPLDADAHAMSVPGVIIGGAWAFAGRRWRPLTAAAWWFGLALAGLSLAPLGLLPPFDGSHPFNADGAMMGLFALFVVVVGIASHRALDRALSAPPPNGPDDA